MQRKTIEIQYPFHIRAILVVAVHRRGKKKVVCTCPALAVVRQPQPGPRQKGKKGRNLKFTYSYTSLA